MHYSINFVDGTGDNMYSVPDQKSATGVSWIYDVDISALLEDAEEGNDVFGEDLIDRILDAVSNAPGSKPYTPNATTTGVEVGGHHQALAKDEMNPDCLVFLDTVEYQARVGKSGLS